MICFSMQDSPYNIRNQPLGGAFRITAFKFGRSAIQRLGLMSYALGVIYFFLGFAMSFVNDSELNYFMTCSFLISLGFFEPVRINRTQVYCFATAAAFTGLFYGLN